MAAHHRESLIRGQKSIRNLSETCQKPTKPPACLASVLGSICAKACLHLLLGSLLSACHNRFNGILCSARLPRASCACCHTVPLPRLVFMCFWALCFRLVTKDSMVFCASRGCRMLPRTSCTCCHTVSLLRLVSICIWAHCF